VRHSRVRCLRSTGSLTSYQRPPDTSPPLMTFISNTSPFVPDDPHMHRLTSPSCNRRNLFRRTRVETRAKPKSSKRRAKFELVARSDRDKALRSSGLLQISFYDPYMCLHLTLTPACICPPTSTRPVSKTELYVSSGEYRYMWRIFRTRDMMQKKRARCTEGAIASSTRRRRSSA